MPATASRQLDGAVATRANELATQIVQRIPVGPIHLIAHSMGGLDARFMLANDLCGLARPGRVLSLSTLSTPHRGSTIADLFLGSKPEALDPRRLAYNALDRVLAWLGLQVGALQDLTSGFAAEFNRQHLNVPHVRYYSYAGSVARSWPIYATHLYIRKHESAEKGANDGLVSVASARWGTFINPPWQTDHFGEIGHTIGPDLRTSVFDHISMLQRVVDRVDRDDLR